MRAIGGVGVRAAGGGTAGRKGGPLPGFPICAEGNPWYLRWPREVKWIDTVKLLLENLPPSLRDQRDTLARCLEAMNRVAPLQAVYLFGSHARGEAGPDRDVDLCLVADGATEQLKAAQQFRGAISEVRPKPAFTLLPITPQRLEEKKSTGDHFFATVLREGLLLVA